MKARQKCPVAGPTTCCCPNKAACIEEKQRVRPQAVRYTQKNKLKKNKYIHIQTHKYSCWYVWLYEERERISFTLVTTAAQACASDLCMCVCVCACSYYFANLSTVSVISRCTPWLKQHSCTHSQATLKTQVKRWQEMIDNQHFHSSTVSQYSVTRNTHTHWSDESPAKTPGGSADNWLLFK